MGTRRFSMLLTLAVLLISCFTTLWQCEGGGSNTFMVSSVTTKPPSWVQPAEYGYKVTLVIEFNRAVDSKKLSAPGSVTLNLKGTRDGRTALNVAGTFKLSTDKKTAVFISDRTGREEINPQAGENIEYTVVISGGKNNAVTDTNGEILDGDANGVAGGDYKKVFETIG